MKVTIYHNPRCSKSRQTLALLEENGIQPVIIQYLNDPPPAATLSSILGQLETDAQGIMRTGEDTYKAARDSLATMDEAERIQWLTANPIVIERPIVVTAKGARIGRPPERILEIL